MGERIAQLRRNRGMSQAKLARLLGLSTSAVAMYEQGRRSPSVPIIIDLANILGVTVNYLMTGKEADGPSISQIVNSEVANTDLAALILSLAWNLGSK